MKYLAGESSSNVVGVTLSGTALPAANSHTENNIKICVNVYSSCLSLVARIMLLWETVKMINWETVKMINLGDSEDDQLFVSHLTPKEKKTVAKLIGS